MRARARLRTDVIPGNLQQQDDHTLNTPAPTSGHFVFAESLMNANN
jgi:hypothetical protein